MKPVSISTQNNTNGHRKNLQEKGQFWTPQWVADAMLRFVLAEGSNQIFDPAVGAGSFLFEAKKQQSTIVLTGYELHPEPLEQAVAAGLSQDCLKQIKVANFILEPPASKFSAIVANPPYIRHHRMDAEMKATVRQMGISTTGKALDGRAGLHIYFLMQSLILLAPGGRLAFIMPADTCEGVFAKDLWQWIIQKYHLEAVITFAPEATPFPGVDTNALVLFIRNADSKETFMWGRCLAPDRSFGEWVASGMPSQTSGNLVCNERTLSEGLRTGFSRSPSCFQEPFLPLGAFAKVLRGVATGANELFFLTCEQAAQHGIPQEFLHQAVGRTRDIETELFDLAALERLQAKGRPTLLLMTDGRALEQFPESLQIYLRHAETLKINERTLIASRNPWYKMEQRKVPPILFAYLGRKNVRFIKNIAAVLPLTGFLCVYPHSRDPEVIDQLFAVLNHPATIKNLALVGKSYGSGAIKVEPRALERLPIPLHLLQHYGLHEYSNLPCFHEIAEAQMELPLAA